MCFLTLNQNGVIMKKIALATLVFLWLLPSCAVSRNPADSRELKDSSDDKIELKDFFDDLGVLNCYSHPAENLTLKVEFFFDKDQKILKSKMYATAKENEATIKDAEHGWFLRSLGIQDQKIDLKGENRSISILESFQDKLRDSLVLQRIIVSKSAGHENLMTGLLSYKNITKPVLINGKEVTVNGILVSCGKN